MALIGRGNAKRLAKDGTTGRTICAARGNAAFEPRDAPQMDSGRVWTTAKVLLDIYGHWLPTESRGFADALCTGENAPQAHPSPRTHPGSVVGATYNAEISAN
ncbi:MAG TPA: hypothetical protein DEP35_09115 [Deltaproteobacteria bacterium]|nr:hypothetical protein [Deltaproteobacteria bacterium]